MKNLFILLITISTVLISCKKDNSISNILAEVTTTEEYNEAKNEGVSLMFFHATWCSICKEQRPLIEEATKLESLENVFFGQVDYEVNEDIRTADNVTGFPTMLIFKDGLEKERLTGKGHSTEKLELLLKEYL
jgi:thioredoxin 1